MHTMKSLKISKGNQNAYIEEEQTTQGTKEKVQKDKQRSTKHTHKTKDPVTRTPLKSGGELASQPSKAIQYWNSLYPKSMAGCLIWTSISEYSNLNR